MKYRLLTIIAGLVTAIAVSPLFAAFEAHVVNVTARIENALFVHPESLEFGTVFPQEHLFSSFSVMFSRSFSAATQKRVGAVDYALKQKPKPRPQTVADMGVEPARDYCHENAPAVPGDPNDPYYKKCFPSICPFLSKHPEVDELPGTPGNQSNDVGLPPFHNPETDFATGKIIKFNSNGNTINNDPTDIWTVDLAVPCFENHCAQDWPDFVLGLNPNAGDPAQYQLPEGLEHQMFGCDIWVEVTAIH
jgi:hypothetical protein